MVPTARIDAYADLLLEIGVNLQPGQPLFLAADLEHADFAHRCQRAAYQRGAPYVQMLWNDDLSTRARLLYSDPAHLDYVPEFDVTRARQAVDEGWARLYLAGSSAPNALGDVEPTRTRRLFAARQRKLKFFSDAYMNNQIQWCIAGVPTVSWACEVYPEVDRETAIAALWETIFTTVRLNEPDPAAAWRQHDARLAGIAALLRESSVRSLHFTETAPADDGQPATDFVVGLTDAPVWVAASSMTPRGVRFLPNMPTEEIFTTPHSAHAEGVVRCTKPGFPLNQRVDGAWFRFSGGEVVEYDAASGREVLDQFFQIPGSTRLGEIALVDVRSPVNRSGVLFYETLFDENCVSHMALGQSYPEGVENGSTMTDSEKLAAGMNQSETHVDYMIGSETLDVDGLTVDGQRLPLMRAGRWVSELGG